MRLISEAARILLVFLGFALATWGALWMNTGFVVIEDLLTALPDLLLVTFIFWIASLSISERDVPGILLIINQWFVAAGCLLIAKAITAYASVPIQLSPSVIMAGSILASLTLSFPQFWPGSATAAHQVSRVLMAGHDLPVQQLDFGPRLLGVVGSSASEGAPFLGKWTSLDQVVRQSTPGLIVLGTPDWVRYISPAKILDWAKAGIQISDYRTVYENQFHRAFLPDCHPTNFLYSNYTTRHNAALQAIYSNTIGLVLLILTMPLLILLMVLVRVFLGPGRIIERTTCAGFHDIPFELNTLRTRRRGEAQPGPLGLFLQRFRLHRLPQLINVIRGELAICGPRPARLEFSNHLAREIPFYAERLSVKPGLFGWSQIHLSGQHEGVEPLGLAYDLYYIRNLSAALDLVILLRTFLRALGLGRAI